MLCTSKRRHRDLESNSKASKLSSCSEPTECHSLAKSVMNSSQNGSIRSKNSHAKPNNMNMGRDSVAIGDRNMLSLQYASRPDLESFKFECKINLRPLFSILQYDAHSLHDIIFRWVMLSQIRMQVEYTCANSVVRF